MLIPGIPLPTDHKSLGLSVPLSELLLWAKEWVSGRAYPHSFSLQPPYG